MRLNPFSWLLEKASNWANHEPPPRDFPVCDFERICYELRPCDVLLVEGRSRISNTIKLLTRSPWSHAALYVGKLQDIKNKKLKEHVENNYRGDPDEGVIIEGMQGKGTIVSPITDYRTHHLRICRPTGISPEDAQRVIAYCIGAIGYDYNLRQIFDLMRLLFPITFMPRRLFSTLFDLKKERHKSKICSSLLAEAFQNVDFPILPKIIINERDEIELLPRNPNLFTPEDFDYSPYFEIVKYPLFGMTDTAIYRTLPWNREGVISNDEDGIYTPQVEISKEKTKSAKEPRRDSD